jgi:NAD(P)H-dependent flavin oxidoreductase YrpB (nitropropane dioxygenase family)
MAQEGLGSPDAVGHRQARDTDEPPLFTAEFFDAQMEVVIQERVPVYASGLGNPGPWMEQLRANGTKVMAVVGAVRHAIQVKSSGLDIIVAQGHDGGGHNSPIGTLALIPQVVDAVGDTPVLGAGGIVDGRGVAAAFMLGAEGVWVGSAFLASEEANIFDFQKQAIVDATEEGTVISRSVTGKPARIIRSKWTDLWSRSGRDPLPMPYQGMVAGPVMAAANRDHRGDINPGFAGQGIGMIRAVRPAAEIFRDLVTGAERALARAR